VTRLQLVVTYADHTIMYYPVTPDGGWKIDNPNRCLVIGRGVPRVHVPLDQVRSFEIAECGCNCTAEERL